MAVRSLKNSGLHNFEGSSNSMLAGYSFNDFHHLQTVQLGGNAASVTFTNLLQYSGEFRHLQIRYAGSLSGESWIGLLINQTSDPSNVYFRHELRGNGSSVSSFGSAYNAVLVGVHTVNAGGMIIDILDAYQANKNKTVRALSGSSWGVQLNSGFRTNESSPISTLHMRPDGGNFVTGSRFSLYGIR